MTDIYSFSKMSMFEIKLYGLYITKYYKRLFMIHVIVHSEINIFSCKQFRLSVTDMIAKS